MLTFVHWRNFLTRIKNNLFFEWAVIGVIILSSLTIGARTYALSSPTLLFLEGLDWAITLFFLLEITIRLLAEERLKHFFRNGWNWFDITIVAVSLIPVSDSEYAFLARLLRLFRVMRLISFVPQLRILVNALLKSIPRMAYVALMMFVIFYVYAILGSLMFGSINPTLWKDVGAALLTLFRVSTFEDWTDVMYETMEVYPLSWIFYLSFIFFSAFVFLNMMIGIVINVLEEEHRRAEQAVSETPTDIGSQLQKIQQQLDHLEKLYQANSGSRRRYGRKR